MEEFIKQKNNEGFSEKVAREFYIVMKEERDRQNRIDKEERDRQNRIDKEERDRQDRINKEEKEKQDMINEKEKEREHQYRMLELQARITVDTNRNEEINHPLRTEKMLMPNFSEEKDNIDAYLERFERVAEINGLDISCW